MNEGIANRIGRRFGPARQIVPLAADASTRLFFRLVGEDGSSRVALVDRDGGEAAFARLLAAHDHLASIGVPVPALLDRAPEIPALLFEDLGGVLLADALRRIDHDEEVRLYRDAAAIAARIAREGTVTLDRSGPLASAPLGRDRLRAELGGRDR